MPALSFQKDRLLKDADIHEVVDKLGLSTNIVGNRTSILCPCHNDHNFGNCYLMSDNTFKCFGCGAKEDVIQLVCLTKGYNFLQALEYIANIYGGVDQYKSTGEFVYVLNRTERDLLKLHTGKIQRLIEMTYSPEPGSNYVVGVVDQRDHILYCTVETVIESALTQLLTDNKELYFEIVSNKVDERITDMINEVGDSLHLFAQESIGKGLISLYRIQDIAVRHIKAHFVKQKEEYLLTNSKMSAEILATWIV